MILKTGLTANQEPSKQANLMRAIARDAATGLAGKLPTLHLSDRWNTIERKEAIALMPGVAQLTSVACEVPTPALEEAMF